MNPWLTIPLADYEAHMASPAVRQRPLLDELFARALDGACPRSVAVLGASGGTGFEMLSGRDLDRVVAVDINPRYLESLKARFGAMLPALQLVCADVADPDLVLPRVDLIHAALIFEYVDPARLLANAHRWLAAQGTLSAVLQLPAADKPAVSATPYRSLEVLAPAMKLVSPDVLCEEAAAAGFTASGSERVELGTGKAFHFGIFRRA
jgi:SAM-dependent methyltransferase